MKRDGLKSIINHIHDGLYIVDRNRVITFWNKAAERITGFSSAEAIGRSCSDSFLTHTDSDGHGLCSGICPLAETMTDGAMREAEIYLHHKNGQRVPVTVLATTLTDREGRVVGGIELFSDIGRQSSSELRVKELEKLALLDRLTQLPNRAYIERELESRFEEFTRYGIPFGLIFMAIDHFKAFNDAYGHDAGDRVLKLVATTFTGNSRAFDLYGRWGGEEFIGIIRNVTPATLRQHADRMRTHIEKASILHADMELHVTLSMGATLVQKNDSVQDIARRANTLLYQSKAAGPNRLTYG